MLPSHIIPPLCWGTPTVHAAHAVHEPGVSRGVTDTCILQEGTPPPRNTRDRSITRGFAKISVFWLNFRSHSWKTVFFHVVYINVVYINVVYIMYEVCDGSLLRLFLAHSALCLCTRVVLVLSQEKQRAARARKARMLEMEVEAKRKALKSDIEVRRVLLQGWWPLCDIFFFSDGVFFNEVALPLSPAQTYQIKWQNIAPLHRRFKACFCVFGCFFFSKHMQV